MDFRFDEYTHKPIVGLYTEPTREIPIIEDLDVLVVGGSPSGVAAAVSAARAGAYVLLVERFGFLGGQSVFSSVTQWEKRAFINNLGAVATRGIGKEMLDRIVALGNSDGLWETPPGCEEMRDGEEWLDVEDIKLVLLEMCEEAGVDLLFHTLAVDVIVTPGHDNPRIGLPRLTGVIFENKTGRFAYRAGTIVDATADMDLVWRALGPVGVEMVPPHQRIKAGFYVYYGGINTARFVDYAITSGEVASSYPSMQDPEKIRRHLREGKLILFNGFTGIHEEADRRGLLVPLEQIFEKDGVMLSLRLGMKWVGQDRWCLSLGGIPNLNLLDAWELTRYEGYRTKLEQVALRVVRLLPGWETAYIARTNLYMGSRQTRTLKARYMLTSEDIFEPDHDRRDVIGRSGAHDPGKNKLTVAYPIPYGIMVPAKLDGVLVCARAVGCRDQVAIGAHRGITPNIVVGQAAGVAAALSTRLDVSPHSLDVSAVQEILRASDVVLEKETVDLGIEIKPYARETKP